jgi:hypothetical protein
VILEHPLPNWKLAQPDCANVGNIRFVMAQTSLSFSNIARSHTTTQLLMILASIGLHYLIANNLGLFGRLDPVKLKPAGGTVKVVDLTPAEQTRVPQAVRSNPLPIDPTPVNPEPATRAPINTPAPRTPGAFAPPTNRSPLPPPSSQIPRTPNSQNPPNQTPRQPQTPPKNPTAKGPEIPIVPRPARPSQQDGTVSRSGTTEGNNSGSRQPRRRPKDDSQNSDSSERQRNPKDPSPSPIPKPIPDPPLPDPDPNDLVALQKKFNQDVQGLRQSVPGAEEKDAKLPRKQNYPTGVNSCRGQKKNGYIFFAILRKKEDPEGNDLQPTKIQISSFLGEEGKQLAIKKLDEASQYVASQTADAGKNILYKFSFEYQASSCLP